MWFTGLVCGSNPWSTRGEYTNYNTTNVVHWFSLGSNPWSTRGEHANYNTVCGSNPWSTALEASTLTITLPMWFTGLVWAQTHDLLEASTLTITLPMWFTGLVCGWNPWSTALEASMAHTHDLTHSRRAR
jgi:hypothetical protein